MLVANFAIGPGRQEHTDVRIRLSNLEAVTLRYAIDFVLGDRPAPAHPGFPDMAPRFEAWPEPFHAVSADPGGLLAGAAWVDAPWRRSRQLWIKTVGISVPSGATRAVRLVTPFLSGLFALGGASQGYAVLRLPARRDLRSLLRRLPQLDRPARVLLAAEAILRQHEWPPLGERLEGYQPQGLGQLNDPPVPIYRPAKRPTSEIVHPLALGTGRSDVELAPEGIDTLERIEIERTGAQLVDRLERGEAVLGAAGFDATDRLVGFLDEIASLEADPNAVDAMNAFLAQQGSRVQLSAAPDPNVPRRRRPRRR